jgi:bacillithiol biosynthesis cysteine-adding enzyme BshC
VDGEGFFVSTGQQPVLFTGPLYVVYKALTASAVARELEKRLGCPVLPLFWVASDDHDWQEVGRTQLLDPGNELRSLGLEPPPGRAGRSVGRTATPKAVKGLMSELQQILPDSEFKGDYLDLIREAYAPGRPLGRAFADTLMGVLGERDFAWVDAGDPRIRRAAAPLFRRALLEGDEAHAALREGEARVVDAGYDPQLRLLEHGAPLFVDGTEGRTRLFREEDGIRLGSGGPLRPVEEVMKELDERPERFSPNVALRPVLESWLLPVGATVLGPSEIAYWAELPDLFRWAGSPPPLVVPRLGWTVVEAKIQKVLDKIDASVEAFEDGGEALVRRETERGRPSEVEESLDAARQSIGRAFGDVEEIVSEKLPGVQSAVGAARHAAFETLDELERRIDERVRREQEVLHGQIRKCAVHLWPDRRPQERVLNPLYYLARYGAAFLDALEAAGEDRAAGLVGRRLTANDTIAGCRADP